MWYCGEAQSTFDNWTGAVVSDTDHLSTPGGQQQTSGGESHAPQALSDAGLASNVWVSLSAGLGQFQWSAALIFLRYLPQPEQTSFNVASSNGPSAKFGLDNWNAGTLAARHRNL